MKLILREYLGSLRERGELDVILPDLLSQMGLNVFSRPSRGTRQYGVDVGAVGSLDGGPEIVHLFSIKAGDLTRTAWDGDGVQALRPSLNEIIDVYIPTHLPVEHRGKDIRVGIVVGGDVREEVRLDVESYCSNQTTEHLDFAQWNGDKLAELIQTHFLREELLPSGARSRLRKSLALFDVPDASYGQFAALIRSLAKVAEADESMRTTVLRQMALCLWILFAWAREDGNMESAYLSAELTLLVGWTIFSQEMFGDGGPPPSIEHAYRSILSAYHEVCSEFLGANVLPHASKLHAVSSAVRGSSGLDVNLKLFDLLGRVGVAGMWAIWGARRSQDQEDELEAQWKQLALAYMEALRNLIVNNPVLLLPVKDDQAIDISIAAALLRADERNHAFILDYFAKLVDRASFAYQVHGSYPCTLRSYDDLLLHPQPDDDYRERVTRGSVLYPIASIAAALLNGPSVHEAVSSFKRDHLQHCNFQLWFPDSSSEAHFYTDDEHGAILSDVDVGCSMEEYLDRIVSECDQSPSFWELSAVKYGWWPLLVVACRHHRVPLPLHLLIGGAQAEEAKRGSEPDIE